METSKHVSFPAQLDDSTAQHIAELFSILGDTSRVKIIAALLAGPMNVQSLAETVGISPSAISHHMRSLRQMHLVRAQKRGRYVYYTLDDEHVRDLFAHGLAHVQHR